MSIKSSTNLNRGHIDAKLTNGFSSYRVTVSTISAPTRQIQTVAISWSTQSISFGVSAEEAPPQHWSIHLGIGEGEFIRLDMVRPRSPVHLFLQVVWQAGLDVRNEEQSVRLGRPKLPGASSMGNWYWPSQNKVFRDWSKLTQDDRMIATWTVRLGCYVAKTAIARG